MSSGFDIAITVVVTSAAWWPAYIYARMAAERAERRLIDAQIANDMVRRQIKP